MKKLAIIGASYLQVPLIQKAKDMGIETHVFAWAANDVGEEIADVFYPISIIEKEQILKKCQEIKIDGICSIASDLAAITVNYVAHAMGLVCNSPECAKISTNKHLMRKAFAANGDPSPKSILVSDVKELEGINLQYPVIVKPLDRSGSRGITKLTSPKGIEQAIENAKAEGFEKGALVEEFAEGQEYSIECISWKGEHHFLAMTKKYTTGAPHFIETGHIEPANVSKNMEKKVKAIVFHALDSLKIENGASHTELKIDEEGNIKLIEIGGRMGGDFIGSSLVALSTGFDFVRAVIDVALGKSPDFEYEHINKKAAVRYIFSKQDIEVYDRLMSSHPEYIVYSEINEVTEETVTDSSNRFGCFVMQAGIEVQLEEYLQEDFYAK